jgi:hypothetical protein
MSGRYFCNRGWREQRSAPGRLVQVVPSGNRWMVRCWSPVRGRRLCGAHDSAVGGDRNLTGLRWSSHVKTTVGGEGCQRRHVKIFVAGRQRIRMDDGTEMEFGPGGVAIIDPGHDGWVVSDETERNLRTRRGDERGMTKARSAGLVPSIRENPAPDPVLA